MPTGQNIGFPYAFIPKGSAWLGGKRAGIDGGSAGAWAEPGAWYPANASRYPHVHLSVNPFAIRTKRVGKKQTAGGDAIERLGKFRRRSIDDDAGVAAGCRPESGTRCRRQYRIGVGLSARIGAPQALKTP